jgi:hypothetical protein
MVSPKSFVRLLGAEYNLMRDAGVLTRFYVSSLLIVLIMLMTWVSIDYAIDLLFHSIVVEILLAIFFCLLFVCIYIFLLNTFAKENRARKGGMSASNIIRIGFIAFMAFLIAQPLVILFYASKLSPAVEEYKRNLLTIHSDKMNALVKAEILNLTSRQNYYLDQKVKFGVSVYNDQLIKIGSAIKLIQEKIDSYERDAGQTIDRSSFFLYRIKKVSKKYPWSWLLTFFIMLLFLLPGYLVYSISSQDEYYQLKKAQEKILIQDAYHSFIERYKMLFNGQVPVFSRYEDPPFNTVRKQITAPESMAQFIEKYPGNG